MNDQFDELAKAMAQSVTRRAAIDKFGIGLADMALACLGLTNRAVANPKQSRIGAICELVELPRHRRY